MDEVEILTRRACDNCDGNGVIYRPRCVQCYQPIGQAEMASPTSEDAMPCGHPWSNCREESECGNCDGKGKIEEWAVLGGATFRFGKAGR